MPWKWTPKKATFEKVDLWKVVLGNFVEIIWLVFDRKHCLLTNNVNFGMLVLSSFWVVPTWIDTFGSSHWAEIFCVNSVLICSPLDIHLHASWRSLPLILDLYCRSESWPEWNSEYTKVLWPVLFQPWGSKIIAYPGTVVHLENQIYRRD